MRSSAEGRQSKHDVSFYVSRRLKLFISRSLVGSLSQGLIFMPCPFIVLV